MTRKCTSWKGGDVWCKQPATNRITTFAMNSEGEEYEKVSYACAACLPWWEKRTGAEIDDLAELAIEEAARATAIEAEERDGLKVCDCPCVCTRTLLAMEKACSDCTKGLHMHAHPTERDLAVVAYRK